MALSSTRSAYPGLSDSLTSFLSTLEVPTSSSSSSTSTSADTTIPLSTESFSTPPSPPDIWPVNTQTLLSTSSSSLSWESLSLDENSTLCNDSLLDYFQFLDGQEAPLHLQLPEIPHSSRPTATTAAVSWEADQLKLLLEQDPRTVLQLSENASHAAGVQSFPTAAEIKRPDVKESFVHPGFYSLSNNSNNNSNSASLPFPRKRSLQEERSPFLFYPTAAAEFRRHSLDSSMYATPPKSPASPPSSLHFQSSISLSSSSSPRQKRGGHNNSDSSDVPLGQPFMATTFGASLPSQSRQQPSMSSHLHRALVARFQQRSASTSLSSLQKPESALSSCTTTATAAFSSPSPTASAQQQQRKRRASKARAVTTGGGDALYHHNNYHVDLLPLYEQCGHSGMGSNDPMLHQYPLNAIPPPLQQRSTSSHHPQHTLPQHNYQPLRQHPYMPAANSTSTLPPFPPKQPRLHHHHHHQQHPYPQHPLQQQQQQRLLHQYRDSSQVAAKTTSLRRNPGEVPASTLPPDHFVFREALFGLQQRQQRQQQLQLQSQQQQQQSRSLSSSHASSAAGSTAATTTTTTSNFATAITMSGASTKRHSEPAVSLNRHLAEQQTADWLKAASNKISTSLPASPTFAISSSTALALRPHPSSARLPNDAEALAAKLAHERSREADKDHDGDREQDKEKEEKEEDLSAAEAFAHSLSTVTTLDPAATKLIDQLRLQEYLGTAQQPSSSSSLTLDLAATPATSASPVSSSLSPTTATSIIASLTSFPSND